MSEKLLHEGHPPPNFLSSFALARFFILTFAYFHSLLPLFSLTRLVVSETRKRKEKFFVLARRGKFVNYDSNDSL